MAATSMPNILLVGIDVAVRNTLSVSCWFDAQAFKRFFAFDLLK